MSTFHDNSQFKNSIIPFATANRVCTSYQYNCLNNIKFNLSPMPFSATIPWARLCWGQELQLWSIGRLLLWSVFFWSFLCSRLDHWVRLWRCNLKNFPNITATMIITMIMTMATSINIISPAAETTSQSRTADLFYVPQYQGVLQLRNVVLMWISSLIKPQINLICRRYLHQPHCGLVLNTTSISLI